MKCSRPNPILLALLMLAFAPSLRAAVPHVINYQGRVAADGVNFSGIGEFKFAIVDDGGATLWRNDGTVAAGEPATAVSLATVSGLYSLQLGDTAVTNMAALTLAPFQGPASDLRLRVWFRRNAEESFQQLAPDTRLAAAPYALLAQRAMTLDPGFLAGGLNGYGLLGTTDSTPLTLQVNGQAVARFGLADGTAHALGSSVNTMDLFATGGTISGGGAAGAPNNVGWIFGTVGGGLGNNSSGAYATIGGGAFNIAGGGYSIIAGGMLNSAGGEMSAVGGGEFNSAAGSSAAITGGSSNIAQADFTAVGGGFGNVANGIAATVPGGWLNSASGANSFAAGRRAKATFPGSFVWADNTNADFTSYGANTFNIRASGGILLAPGTKFLNFVDFSECTIGSSTAAALIFSVNGTVVGRLGLPGHSHTFGYSNNIAEGMQDATISGGTLNQVGGSLGTIGGGNGNQIDGQGGTIGGGAANRAAGLSTVSGGNVNHATGYRSTIPGGIFNTASGLNSFAAGSYAKALHDGAWVWNTTNADWASTGVNQFLVNAAGGMGLNTNAPTATLHVNGTAKIQGANNWDVTNSEGDFRVGNDVQRFKIGVATGGGGAGDVLMRAQGGTARVFFKAPGGFNFHTDEAGTAGVAVAPGGGSWTMISDRNLKENLTPVDPLDVLEKVAAMPVSTWNYKAQDKAIRHVGPMAQDFKAAFGVGESDTGITTVDADGVALAAIQGVNKKLEQEVASLRRELADLRATVAKLATTR